MLVLASVRSVLNTHFSKFLFLAKSFGMGLLSPRDHAVFMDEKLVAESF